MEGDRVIHCSKPSQGRAQKQVSQSSTVPQSILYKNLLAGKSEAGSQGTEDSGYRVKDYTARPAARGTQVAVLESWQQSFSSVGIKFSFIDSRNLKSSYSHHRARP